MWRWRVHLLSYFLMYWKPSSLFYALIQPYIKTEVSKILAFQVIQFTRIYLNTYMTAVFLNFDMATQFWKGYVLHLNESKDQNRSWYFTSLSSSQDKQSDKMYFHLPYLLCDGVNYIELRNKELEFPLIEEVTQPRFYF